MALDPDAVTRKTFETNFRGYDPMEVKAYLLSLADELRAAEDRELDLELRLGEAERRARAAREQLQRVADQPVRVETVAPSLEELDPDEVMRLVGEETVRVLQAARAGAEELRQRASSEVEALRDTAQREADELVGAARAEAEELRAAAQVEADGKRVEVESQVSALRAQAEELVVGARAEAEGVLAAAREAAEATVAAATTEAEELVVGARAEAEGVLSAAREAAEATVAAATTEAEELVVGARAEAEGVLAAAREAAEATVAAATTEAEELVVGARAEAEQLVGAARALRRDVLGDLSSRRHEALQQLEQLRAGRDHLARALGSARGLLDGLDAEVGGLLDGARDAARQARRDVARSGAVPVDALAALLEGRPAEWRAAPPRAAAPVAGDPPHPDAEPAADAVGGLDVDPSAAAAAGAPDDHHTPPSDAPAGEADEGEIVTSLFARIRADADSFEPLQLPVDAPRPATGADEADPGVATAGPTLFDGDADGDADGDRDVARARALAEPERRLDRALKRVLAEEQNLLLDGLRRAPTPASLDAILGDAEQQALRYGAAARDELVEAAAAGGAVAGRDVTEVPVVDDLAAELAVAVVNPLRGELAGCWPVDDEAWSADLAPVVASVREVCRRWRASVLPELAERAASSAFQRGAGAATSQAARPSAPVS